jgi:hypothetical protein
MSRPPELLPARDRVRSWRILAINVAIHSLLLLVTIRPWLPPSRPLLDHPDLFMLRLPSEGPHAVEMVYLTPADGQGDGQQDGVPLTRPPDFGVVPQVVSRDPLPVVRPPAMVPDTGRFTPIRPAPTDEVAGRTGGGRLGPARGQGTLWVQPLPLAPRELAQRLSRSHVELVDSAVSAIVQAYIDSVVSTPTMPGTALPSWTTDIEGQTFGIDSKYIYLGPLKIPSALLALLPIPGGGNADLQ